MTEKSRLAALARLAERADRYGSLESRFLNDEKKTLLETKLKSKLAKLSDEQVPSLESRNYTYGL